MLVVKKFGGSSLAGPERLRRAAAICRETRRGGHDLAVVVSAMGDATDELIETALRIDPSPPPGELDALMACGEQQSAAMLAITLASMGEEARSFTGWQSGIITDRRHKDARICQISPARISAALRSGQIAVIAGFQGVSPGGDITTLGRGGSDTTAVALAAALKADRCMIYSDVDGIYTADPRLVTGARLLSQIDYGDMLALALAGSQVLHSRSVELALEKDVELQLLSTFTGSQGSRVCRLSEEERPDFAGVTRSEAASLVTVVGKAADASTLSRLVLMLGRARIPVLSGSAERCSVSVKVAPAHLHAALELVHREIMPEGPTNES